MSRNGNKVQIIIFICAVVIFAALVALFVFQNGKTDFEEPSQQTESAKNDITVPELKLISSTENGDSVDIVTTYGSFSYPFAFTDVIIVKTENQAKTSKLQFFAMIDDEEIAIYTIHYNADVGIPCGKLKISEDGDEIRVSVVFEDAPESLPSDWLLTFQATQETFNDVIASMGEDGHFTSIQ